MRYAIYSLLLSIFLGLKLIYLRNKEYDPNEHPSFIIMVFLEQRVLSFLLNTIKKHLRHAQKVPNSKIILVNNHFSSGASRMNSVTWSADFFRWKPKFCRLRNAIVFGNLITSTFY